jgi:hypothetical protein
MGTVRALLSFCGVPDSSFSCNKKKNTKHWVRETGQRTPTDGMTEAGLSKVGRPASAS